MKSTFIFLLITFSFSVFSNWCDRSYRHENFWISAAGAFGENVQKNTYLDEMCWRIGKSYGDKVMADNSRNSIACIDAFKAGKEDGLNANTQNSDFPAECYNVGVRYGLSTLVSQARLGKNVQSSANCVKSYKSGLNDGRKDIVAQPGMDKVESTCYMAGFQDGMLFRDLL